PWKELVVPAVEAAREGVELTRPQAYLHAILDLILRHSDEGRRVYGNDGSRLVAGDRLAMPDLADTLEALGEGGADLFYRGELAARLSDYIRNEGGDVTREDLAAYRVISRRPVRTAFRGHEFVSNPPPSSGGLLIGYGLLLLDRAGRGREPGSADAIALLVEVMREQGRVREGSFTRELYRGGLARRLYSDD